MTRCSLFLLMLALLLPMDSAQAAPPPPDLNDVPAYLSALVRSTDPQSHALRQQIADGPAALARERAAAEKEGIFTRLSQLSPPLPPDSQNAAPLYAQALTGRYAYTPEQIAAVQKEYDARQDIFTLLHQAANRPDYVLPPDGSRDFRPPFTDYAGLREDARELKTESFLLATQGRYSEAIRQQTRGYRLADHVGSIPTLISYLVAQAVDSIATSGFQDILSMAGPNAVVDAQVTQAVTENSGHFSLAQALRGEVATDDSIFATLRRDGPAALADFATDDPTPSASVKHILTPAQKRMYLNFLNGLPRRGAASRQVTLAAAFLLGEKAETGAYPDALPSEFRDPFMNKPLGYRREGTDGCVVYSTGSTGNFESLFRYPAQAVPVPPDMLK